jgi:hypothetical protein
MWPAVQLVVRRETMAYLTGPKVMQWTPDPTTILPTIRLCLSDCGGSRRATPPRNAQIFTYTHVRVLMLAIYSIFKMTELRPPLESSPESGDARAVPVSANIRHILGTGSSAAIYVRTNLRAIMDDRVLI